MCLRDSFRTAESLRPYARFDIYDQQGVCRYTTASTPPETPGRMAPAPISAPQRKSRSQWARRRFRSSILSAPLSERLKSHRNIIAVLPETCNPILVFQAKFLPVFQGLCGFRR